MTWCYKNAIVCKTNYNVYIYDWQLDSIQHYNLNSEISNCLYSDQTHTMEVMIRTFEVFVQSYPDLEPSLWQCTVFLFNCLKNTYRVS